MNHDHLTAFASPPAWSVLLGNLGRGSVWLALVAFVLSGVFACLKRPRASGIALGAGVAGLIGTAVVLGSLVLTHRFEYLYVWNHSALDHEPQYLFASMWGGQEGSFLLWALMSSLSVLLVLPRVKGERLAYLGVSALFLACLAGILAYESPFKPIPLVEGQWIVPPDGKGLTASLLNYWMVIHPPTIFLGFGALTPMFSWAAAATITGDLETWVRGIRPWAIFAASVLGIGLCMGGFWAYETLGWGGFWAWDPVENTSFVPWCAAVAFIHGIIVQVTRKRSHLSNLWLGAAPFLLFCYGTFLTRSGFLGDASTHSFASMDLRALWILVGVIAVAVLGFAGLYGWRYKALKASLPVPAPSEGLLSKQAFYNGGIWLTCAIGVFTAVGMSVPLIQYFRHADTKVVEERLYHQVLSWPFLPLMLLLAVGPLLSWKKLPWKEVWNRSSVPLALAIGLTGGLVWWVKLFEGGLAFDPKATTVFFGPLVVPRLWWVAFLCGVCLFSILANLARLIKYAPRDWPGRGGLIAHVGLGMALVGLIGSRGYEKKTEVLFNSAFPAEFFGRQATVVGRTASLVDRSNQIRVQVTKEGRSTEVRPGLYYMDNGEEKPVPMKWPYVQGDGLSDFYYVAHELTFEATEPMKMDKGQVAVYKNLGIKYDGFQMVGEPGQPGTKFVANVSADVGDKVMTLKPAMVLQQGSMDHEDAKLTDALKVRLVSIDAGDKSATLQLMFSQPAYPAEVYYKPLTRFVWWGVGIMTLGGFLAAWSRRATFKSKRNAAEQPAEG